MANQMFDPAREGFLKGEIVWTATPTIKASLVRGYTYDATDKFVSDLSGATIHATATLANKVNTNGVADADNITTFGTPAANANNHIIIIYQASAVGGGADVASSAQRLIAYIDTATGLPIQPNGADIAITWDDGANKIFKL